MKAKITNMKTKEQIIEILKRRVQNLIVEDTISPLFWEDFADELQTKELTDEKIQKWAYDESKQNICGNYENGLARGKELGAKWYKEQINK